MNPKGFVSDPPTRPSTKRGGQSNLNNEKIRIIPSLMLRLSSLSTCILRNEVLSGYSWVSKRIRGSNYFSFIIYHELRYTARQGMVVVYSVVKAHHSSRTGYPAHEIFVPDECSSLTTLGTWRMMFIRTGLARSTPPPGKVFVVNFPNNVPFFPYLLLLPVECTQLCWVALPAISLRRTRTSNRRMLQTWLARWGESRGRQR